MRYHTHECPECGTDTFTSDASRGEHSHTCPKCGRETPMDAHSTRYFSALKKGHTK